MMRLQSNSFRMLCEVTPQPIWVVDPGSGYFLEVNEAARTLFGYSRDEFLSLKVQSIHSPEDAARVQELLASGQGPKQRSATFRQRTKDGKVLELEIVSRPMEYDGRKAVICVGHDLTQALTELRGTRSRLDALLVHSPVVFFCLDREGVFTLSEGRGLRELGLTPGQVVGKSVFDVYRENPKILDAMRRSLAGEELIFSVTQAGRVYETRLSPEPEGKGVIGVAVDVTERARGEALLDRQRAAMETAIDGMGIREGAKITFANAALARIHGYDSPAELVGKDWRELYPPEEARRIEQDVLPAFLRDGRWRGESIGRRRDGSTFLEEVSVTLIAEDVAVCVMRDITEQKRVAEQLSHALACEKAARREAEAASRAKDEFLAILSHEMRTPMTAMLGWTWLMKTGALDGEARDRALDTIHRNMQQQSQTIEDLLDVSRIVTGKLKLEPRMLDPRTVVQAAVESVRPAAEAKSMRIEVAGDASIPPVLGDPDRLQQVFWNILSNAVKFTPEGGSVRVEFGRAGSRVQVKVSDSGQGLAPEHLSLIFDRFRQAEDPLTRKFRGLGLGLAIVKLLVEAHGGVIEASSAGIGRGATFTVQLPVPALRVDAPLAAPAARRGPPAALPKLAGLRVLLVEAEGPSRDILETLLRKCGVESSYAAGAEEAFALFVKAPPDVLVVDVGLAGEESYSLVRRIRALKPKEGGGVPAVALCASLRGEDRARILLAGFQLHVQKPVEPMEFAAALGALSGRSLAA